MIEQMGKEDMSKYRGKQKESKYIKDIWETTTIPTEFFSIAFTKEMFLDLEEQIESLDYYPSDVLSTPYDIIEEINEQV